MPSTGKVITGCSIAQVSTTSLPVIVSGLIMVPVQLVIVPVLEKVADGLFSMVPVVALNIVPGLLKIAPALFVKVPSLLRAPLFLMYHQRLTR